MNKKDEIKIGVISDTHDNLKSSVCEIFSGVDYIFHAGDIGNRNNILTELEIIAPVFAVRGNCDSGFQTGGIPWELINEIAGIKIYMAHDLANIDPETEKDCDLVIYGHSHSPEMHKKGKTYYLNPGSASQRRRSKSCSVAIVRISQKGIEIDLIPI